MSPSEYTKMSLKHTLLDIFEMIFGAACHIYTQFMN